MSASAAISLRRHGAPSLLIAYADAVAQLPVGPDAKRLRRNAATRLLTIHPRPAEWMTRPTPARLADLDYQEGHAPQAVARLEAALEALSGVEPDAHVAAVAGQLGRFLVLSGEGDRAEPHIELALEIAGNEPKVIPAAATASGKRIDCLIGEKLREQWMRE